MTEPDGINPYAQVSPRRYPPGVVPDSSYFFSDRRLSQLFNVDAWTQPTLEDGRHEPPPEPAPRGSYCPPSPGTPFQEFGPYPDDSFLVDDVAVGMSRLSRISGGSSLTADGKEDSRRLSRSATAEDTTPTPGTPSSRFSGLSDMTGPTSHASSSLPSVLSDLVGDSAGVDDLFEDDEKLSLPRLRSWSEQDGEVNWQERCFELEISLQKFRDRAGKIRDLLREKLADMEQRVFVAENRAQTAEQKARAMERKLSQGSPIIRRREAAGSRSFDGSLDHERISTDDEILSTLTTQVEEQKQLRMEDAKKVEAKAAKIKEWVTNKLKDLEEQNAVLREQNAKCNVQLDLLRGRLAHLSTLHDKDAEKALLSSSLKCGRLGSHENLSSKMTSESLYIPSRPSTLGRDTRSKSRSPSSLRRASSSETNAHFQQQNGHRQIPQLDIEKRSSKTSRMNSGSLDLETPQSMSPKSPLEVMLNSLGSLTKPTKPVPQPRSKVPDGATSSKSVDSLELDFRYQSGSSLLSDGTSHVKDELHDYSEIYTPNEEGGAWQEKPPPPPLHRFPSWESRIYQVAQKGLSVGESGSTNDAQMNSSSLGNYPEIHVPVYAAVKGRASQIRSVPFTGDSSDSSDGEDHCPGLGDPIRHPSHTPSSNESTNSSPSKSKTASLSPAKVALTSPPPCLKREISFESGLSDDYAIPPDARSDILSLDSTLPSTASARTSCVDIVTNTLTNSHLGMTSPRLDTVLEKSGNLTKLSGKLKTWKKKYFVLKDGKLCYWKNQHDVHRKPSGEITLDDGCSVSRSEGSHTFELNTGSKMFYLSADSPALVEEWARVLQNVIRRNAARILLKKEDSKPSVQGWLDKVKHGHEKYCWCMLVGRVFLYYKNPSDQNALGQINMRDTRIEELDKMSDSEGEENPESDAQRAEVTIGLYPAQQAPTYLIFPNKQEKDNWLYHLTIVSGGVSNIGTEYEQLIQKLMELDGDANCILWKHPLLLHSKEPTSTPLATLSNPSLQSEALKLFKSCQLFTSVLMDSSAIDYHVILCQNALQLCLTHTELQPELYCSLIKLTSAHAPHKQTVQANKALNKIKQSRNLLTCTTQSLIIPEPVGQKGLNSSTSMIIDPKVNPPHFTFIQGWQFLSLAVSLFVPKNNKLLWYLKAHLQRYADTKTEIGKFAIYCQRALQKTLDTGGREIKPSRMEVLSILLKNPYHHSLPHAIPVHFLNGTYQVVGFGGSTSIDEFLASLNREIGCRHVFQSGFALFSDDPIERDLEHCLNGSAKLCDVISKWETALREKGSGKFENTKVIRLLYKNRLYWKSLSKNETDKEKLLLCYQVNTQLQQAKYPVTKELSLELTTLMAQIHMGEVNTERSRGSGSGGPSQSHVLQVFNEFYPKKFKEGLSEEMKRQILDNLQEKWQSLRGRTQADCVRIFLTCARKWPFFGATLFPATTALPDPMSSGPSKATPVWVAVSEEAVSLLERSSMQPIVKYNYNCVVTFGGCQEDFMLVVHTLDRDVTIHPPGTHKLLLCMTKPKILELTLLIADYMNALGRGVPGPHLGTLTRHGSVRSNYGQANSDILHMSADIDKVHKKDST